MSNNGLKNDNCYSDFDTFKNTKLTSYQFYKPSADKSECGKPSEYIPIYNTTTRPPLGSNLIELENQMRGTDMKLTACGTKTQTNVDLKKVDITYPEMCGIVKK